MIDSGMRYNRGKGTPIYFCECGCLIMLKEDKPWCVRCDKYHERAKTLGDSK